MFLFAAGADVRRPARKMDQAGGKRTESQEPADNRLSCPPLADPWVVNLTVDCRKPDPEGPSNRRRAHVILSLAEFRPCAHQNGVRFKR
jgi:hypothetical protein